MQFFSTPQDQNFAALSAEIAFVSDLQIAIEGAMDRRGVTQADLARLLSVSEARVSQMLSDNGANLRARTIAKIAHALDAKACLSFEDADGSGCVESLRTRRLATSSGSWGQSVAANEDVWEQEAPLYACGGR